MELEAKAACDKISGLIIEYIDGELDGDTAELVERHIEVCADYRKLYCDLRAVCRAAAEAAYSVPGELHTRVMAAVRAEKSARLFRTKIMRKVSAYAGIGIAAMLCIFIGAAAIFNNLDTPDLFFAARFSDGTSEELALSQYSYNFTRNSAPTEDGYILEAADKTADRGSAVTENECWSEPEKASEGQPQADSADAAPPKTTAGLVPETTAAATGHDNSMANNAVLLVGEWELTAGNGKPIILTFCQDLTFRLVGTGGSVIAGNYAVSSDVISFSYLGGTAEYRFCLYGSGLGLSYLSGDGIIE